MVGNLAKAAYNGDINKVKMFLRLGVNIDETQYKTLNILNVDISTSTSVQ